MNRRRVDQTIIAFITTFALLSSNGRICVSADNNHNGDEGEDDDANVLTIAEQCAPKSRSRHAVTVDRMTMTCSENDDQGSNCNVGGLAQVTIDCEYRRHKKIGVIYHFFNHNDHGTIL